MSAPALRVGWCPGVLRPMQAGDGLLLRVKPRGGRLTLAQALGLAELARASGSGQLDITGRANLQLRGIAPEGVDAATRCLAALGLVDATPEGEAVRNVVSSPPLRADGPHVQAVADLEARLADDPALWRLPAKFAWVVDDGGPFGLDDVRADVRFVRQEDGLLVVLGEGRDGAAGRCGPGEVAQVASRLADAFLGLCRAQGLEPHRMEDLVAAIGPAAIFEAAGLEAMARTLPAGRGAPVGHDAAAGWLGAVPAFGRLDAAGLAAFTRAAGDAGAAALHVTTARGLLVTGLAPDALAHLVAMLEAGAAAGFILDPADSRLAVAACAGRPACHRATTDVLADAATLAPLLPRVLPTPLHVSGCSKGCARPAASAWTLVGNGGLYDLVRKGRAGDAPLMRGLPFADVMAMVPALAEAATPPPETIP